MFLGNTHSGSPDPTQVTLKELELLEPQDILEFITRLNTSYYDHVLFRRQLSLFVSVLEKKIKSLTLVLTDDFELALEEDDNIEQHSALQVRA